MDLADLRDILQRVASGEVAPEEAAQRLKDLPYKDLGYATVDHHRHLRRGFPEVVFGMGKSPDHIAGIVTELRRQGGNILVTRVDPHLAEDVRGLVPDLEYDPVARVLTLRQQPWRDRGRGTITVVCAGTSDLPVAREAYVTAELMDNRVRLIADVGVAGIHRLMDKRHLLEDSSVIIVVAGMEGALPSVVGGMVARPIVAVPTSVGYGAALGGLSTLLAMLNSCAAGVTVVNIDNGFGAAYAASLINRRLPGEEAEHHSP